MLTAYVVLDGFDFGAGILHLFVARDRRRAPHGPRGHRPALGRQRGLAHRRRAASLVFAFPRAYAAAFSGFYLPLMIVLWLLVLRGVSIEFRAPPRDPALARVLGRRLRLVRRSRSPSCSARRSATSCAACPIGADGYFHAPLFADPLPGGARGRARRVHRARRPLHARGPRRARRVLPPLEDRGRGADAERPPRRAALGGGARARRGGHARHGARPARDLPRDGRAPVAWPLVVLVPCSVGVIVHALRRGRELLAFVGSRGAPHRRARRRRRSASSRSSCARRSTPPTTSRSTTRRRAPRGSASGSRGGSRRSARRGLLLVPLLVLPRQGRPGLARALIQNRYAAESPTIGVFTYDVKYGLTNALSCWFTAVSIACPCPGRLTPTLAARHCMYESDARITR